MMVVYKIVIVSSVGHVFDTVHSVDEIVCQLIVDQLINHIYDVKNHDVTDIASNLTKLNPVAIISLNCTHENDVFAGNVIVTLYWTVSPTTTSLSFVCT